MRRRFVGSSGKVSARPDAPDAVQDSAQTELGERDAKVQNKLGFGPSDKMRFAIHRVSLRRSAQRTPAAGLEPNRPGGFFKPTGGQHVQASSTADGWLPVVQRRD